MADPDDGPPDFATLTRMRLDNEQEDDAESSQCEEEVDVGGLEDNIAQVDEIPNGKKKTRSTNKPQRILATFNSHDAFSEAWEGMKRGFHRNSKTCCRDVTTIYYICSKRGCNVRRTLVIGLNKVLVFESIEDHVNHDRKADMEIGMPEESLDYGSETSSGFVNPNDTLSSLCSQSQHDNSVLDEMKPEEEGQRILLKLFPGYYQPPGTSGKENSNEEDSPKKSRVRQNRIIGEFRTKEEFDAAWPNLKMGFSFNSQVKDKDNIKRAYYICSKKGCKVRRTVEYEEHKTVVFESVFNHFHDTDKDMGLSEEIKKRVLELHEQKFQPQRIMIILEDDYNTGQLKTKPPTKRRVISDFLYRLQRGKSTPTTPKTPRKRRRPEKETTDDPTTSAS